jgi:hypothetical protein
MKLQKTISYLLLAFFIIGCSAKSNTTNIENVIDTREYDYVLSIDIDASKEKVWNIITNFKNYPKWTNVIIMKNNDNLEIGKNFDVTIYDTDGSVADNFQAIVVSNNKYQSFSASQTIWTKSFFKATHHFVIKEISKNKIQFIQKWELEGVIGYLFEGIIFDVLGLFETMNLELKKEAEK